MSTKRDETWRMEANDARRAITMASDVPFDELCIGGWFQLERMSTSTWILIVGETRFGVAVTAKGVVTVVHTDGPLRA